MKLAFLVSATEEVLIAEPLLRRLQAANVQICAIVPKLSAATKGCAERMGFGVLECPVEGTGLNPFSDMLYCWHVFRILREERIDMVLNRAAKPVIFGSLAARAAGKGTRVFSWIPGLGQLFAKNEERSWLGFIVRFLYRFVLRFNRVVFFENSSDERLFREHGLLPRHTSSCVIPGQGVDLQKYRYIEPAVGPPRFVFISRLLKEKGLDDFVRAARIVRSKHPGVSFDVAGPFHSGKRAVSPEVIHGWEAEGLIHYHGTVPDSRPLLAGAHVVVLPTFYPEGLPRILLEAMAVGRPIITTRIPGCDQTVEHRENGFLVEPRDVGSLAAALNWFIEHPESIAPMGRISRHIAEEKFDAERVAERIVSTMLNPARHPERS
jgi:glycosyltransferase involved in cell wall biosynthesis